MQINQRPHVWAGGSQYKFGVSGSYIQILLRATQVDGMANHGSGTQMVFVKNGEFQNIIARWFEVCKRKFLSSKFE